MNAIERAALLDRAERLLKMRDFATLDQLTENVDSTYEEPQLIFFRALALSHTGRESNALALLRALRPGLPAAESRLLLRVLNLEGALLLERGELLSAREMFLEVLSRARPSDDPRFVAAASMNLGTVALIRHEWDRAIADLHRAMGVSAGAGLRHQVAGCHHNLGMAFREIRLLSSSASHFEKGRRLYAMSGTASEMLAIQLEEALLTVISGEPQLALNRIDTVLRRVEETQNVRLLGESFRVRGIIWFYHKEFSHAEKDLEAGQKIGFAEGLKILYAECSELLARVAQKLGDVQRAEALQDTADHAYAEMRVPNGKADLWLPEEKMVRSAAAG